MKFLIQRINGEIKHDFAFALLRAIEFNNWCRNPTEMKVKFLDYIEVQEPSDIYPIQFKPMHKNYVPIGSVEFVSEFLGHFYGLTPKPINVPEDLYRGHNYAGRDIWNGNHLFLDNCGGMFFVKSADKIKGFKEVVECNTDNFTTTFTPNIPIGNYQYSNYIRGIESEWRAFVFKGKLVGLQNYCGDFTLFPNAELIKDMIKAYKSAPVAYTLDVGVRKIGSYHKDTVIIECHDFFSCGLYGFTDSSLPFMFSQWFWQYIQINMVKEYEKKQKNENE